jgi:hypothetical protein
LPRWKTSSGGRRAALRRPAKIKTALAALIAFGLIPMASAISQCVKLMFGALIRAERWRGLRFTEFELRQTAAVRKDLDQEYEPSITPLARSSQPRPPPAQMKRPPAVGFVE